jgi:hypothetical protein
MQGNNLRAACSGFANLFDRAGKILFRVARASHLHETNGKFIRHGN